MEDYENKEWGYVIGFILLTILCWHVTGWTADAIGFGDRLRTTLEQSVSWGDGWWVAFRIALIITGAMICVAGFFVAVIVFHILSIAGRWLFGVIARVVKFIIDIAEWLLNGLWDITVTISLAVWDAITWPFRFLFGLLADHYAAFAQNTKQRRYERAQLKQAYKEKYRQDFRSFRAFMKYWKALQRGENPPYPGSENKADADRGTNRKQKRSNEDSGGPSANGRSPYHVALDVLGLTEPFTKAELNARYKKAIARCHPDKTGGDDREAKRVNMARDAILKRKGWS